MDIIFKSKLKTTKNFPPSTETTSRAPSSKDSRDEDVLDSEPSVKMPMPQSTRGALSSLDTLPKEILSPTGLWPGRSKIQEVCPGLSITNCFGAKNQRTLDESGISHIVVCANELPEAYPERFSYLKLSGLSDNTNTVLLPYLTKALPWIKSAISSGGRVLLHCASGSSRSGAVLVAYLMWDQHISAEEAIGRAISARPIIAPNPGFLEQLKAFDTTKI